MPQPRYTGLIDQLQRVLVELDALEEVDPANFGRGALDASKVHVRELLDAVSAVTDWSPEDDHDWPDLP